jgi:hypothetical protein
MKKALEEIGPNFTIVDAQIVLRITASEIKKSE